MAIRTYDGTDTGHMIFGHTDPWVAIDGVPYDWMERPLPPAPDNPCGICCDSPVPGALQAMNTPSGIESCDECGVLPGDLEAALALAALVGGSAYYESED